MRYLNKITFINSASVKYAEVNLDGNIHFIGTQGVGKSTLLRAILFFYNADKTKLGIPREKKNFDEYYFPYQNSYIVFEVMNNDVAYSVLVFKSQGRAAFRFIDSAYSKTFFIDDDGRAFESWNKTREVLGKSIYYSRIINNYEDYRNIIYGNNSSFEFKFRKYAILESKQYQNIPRTIQNVFLNSKLDAEFIKETIIKSLNEEELKIDLDTYSRSHLKDFEENLNDIRIWKKKNKKGEINVNKQAELIAENYRDYKYLDKGKLEIANQLSWAVEKGKEQLPKHNNSLNVEELKRDKLRDKLDKSDKLFDGKRQQFDRKIGVQIENIKKVNEKIEEYNRIKIDDIILRVSHKSSLLTEKKHLVEKQVLLTSKFSDIRHKYDMLVSQIKNQLVDYTNKQNANKNSLKDTFVSFKESLNSRYSEINDKINKQHKEQLDLAVNIFDDKKAEITKLKIKRSEIKYKRFFDVEIEECKECKIILDKDKRDSENEINKSKEQIKNTKKEWELEKKAVIFEYNINVEKQKKEKADVEKNIISIKSKLDNFKDSLYVWLNEKVPNWNNTIGKVIDEENILFQKGLNPVIDSNKGSFYGIKLDLSQIDRSVKTIDDYKDELEIFDLKLKEIAKSLCDLFISKEDDLKKLKKRLQPKLSELSDCVLNNEYIISKVAKKITANTVSMGELLKKAKQEKNNLLETIEENLSIINEESIKASQHVNRISKDVKRQVNAKIKEKESLIKLEKESLEIKLSDISAKIKEKESDAFKKLNDVDVQKKSELDNKGIDTKILDEINEKSKEIDGELIFIEEKADIVADYNKDKREYIDRESEFKAERKLIEKELNSEKVKYKENKDRFTKELKDIKENIAYLNERIKLLKEDLSEFEKFTNSEVYSTLDFNIVVNDDANKTDKRILDLINDLIGKYYESIRRIRDLESSITKFTGNFQDNNIFKFATRFGTTQDYLLFAEELKEFIDEDKISEYEKRINERFAHIVILIGKETNEILSKGGDIQRVINKINTDFVSKNFVGAIKSMEMRTIESSNKIMRILIDIKKYNDENGPELGEANLFSSGDLDSRNEKAVNLLKHFVKEMSIYKSDTLSLSDSFGLEFRIVENENDTGWVEKLSNVGSEGTDVLVKAMINIMLLNVFKTSASKRFKDFKLHCMMDEIGKLHPNNVKGILKFANDRNILLINGSPTSYNATDYRYVYILSKDNKSVTSVKRLVKKIPNVINEIV